MRMKSMESQKLSKRRRKRNQKMIQEGTPNQLYIQVLVTYVHGIMTNKIGTLRKCVKSGFFRICLTNNRSVKLNVSAFFSIMFSLRYAYFIKKGPRTW